MLAVVITLLLTGSSEPKVEREQIDAFLLETAEDALARDDTTIARRALSTWASLSTRDALPASARLGTLAADAIARAKADGVLRVYGSRTESRVRVGLADPANVVDRVDVWLELEDGGVVRLSRLEDGADDRYEYLVDPRDTRRIFVDAISTRFGAPLRLVRATLAPSEGAGVPSAPDPERLHENVMRNAPPAAPPARVLSDSPIPWWVIVGGVVAAGLAGAAVYQESRF